MIQILALLSALLACQASKADRITHYFTVVAPKINNKVCKMEGTMFVRGVLYYWHDGRCIRSSEQCRWGIGHRLNCLDPCKSVAADPKHWRTGQRVYIKQLAGKLCPSTGRKMNGRFIVADVGGWIKGKRRFDLFTGICSKQSGGVCSRYTSSRTYGASRDRSDGKASDRRSRRRGRVSRNKRPRRCNWRCRRNRDRQYRFQDALLGAIEKEEKKRAAFD